MATNKHAQIRYNTLDKCFRNSGRNYTLEDLLESCNEAIFEFDPDSDGIKNRQLFEDIRFMKSDQGWNIELNECLKLDQKKIYRYLNPDFSISNQPLNESDANHLKSALLTLSRFKGLPQFNWIEELSIRLEDTFNLSKETENIINFEENEFLKGKEHITQLYDAIHYKKVLKIKYKNFKSNMPQIFMLHPYYLKQYNNRWFLFGKDERFETLTNLALDRIENIEETKLKYIETNIDFEEYFEDIIGVSISDKPSEKIVLRIDKQQWPYIKTKPLHGSQKVISDNEKFVDISLDVIPNNELENLILQFGEKMHVIKPVKFRKKLKIRIQNLYQKYMD